MQLAIGDPVRVWDDDRRRWWEGEVTVVADSEIEVTILNGDHPRHPWQAETISVPLDPECIQPIHAPAL